MIPVTFLVDAVKAAKNEMIIKYAGTCCVHATGQYTAFNHEGEVFAVAGNLHAKVDAPYCIEFDLVYSHGSAIIKSQRVYEL